MIIRYHELTFPSMTNNRQQRMIDNKNNLEGVEIHILILNISAAVYRSLIKTMREISSLTFYFVLDLSLIFRHYHNITLNRSKTLHYPYKNPTKSTILN